MQFLSQKKLQSIHDRQLLESTTRCRNEPFFRANGAMRPSILVTIPTATSSRKLFKPKRCYVCKKLYSYVHHFYHQMCPICADQNFSRRTQSGNLIGHTALVTGARIKIGYEIALKLLRAGASVIATTRFEIDAAKKFSSEPDFEQWQNRLHIYGLDLRHIPSVELFTKFLCDNFRSLDIIINNAAQTNKKSPEYYKHLAQREIQSTTLSERQLLGHFTDEYLANEKRKIQELLSTQSKNLIDNSSVNLDEFNEPIDMSSTNSWMTSLTTVDTLELIETQVINSIAPFLINSQLKTLLLNSRSLHKFIINVSSMEGKFNRENKTHRHPHTNMSKAALNMMTRTCAQDYARDNIYMNSVDTGWITEETPFAMKVKNRIAGKVPPLDCIDGAARVLAPIFDTINQEKTPEYGKFYKNYDESEW